VTGSCRGYEHWGHCASITICRVSLEASRGPLSSVMSRIEVSGTLGRVRRGKGVLLRGMEDINHESSRAGPLEYPSGRSSVYRRDSAYGLEVFGMKPPSAALIVCFQNLSVCKDLGRSCRCFEMRYSSRLVSVSFLS
jgi:hypothetical protein